MRRNTDTSNEWFETYWKPTRSGVPIAHGRVVPWAEFSAVIEPYYPEARNGRPPVGLERNCGCTSLLAFNLSDVACEDVLYDVPAFREFCEFNLGRERIPDATTLMNFRYLLEYNNLGAVMFAKMSELLLANSMKLSGGAIVDATIIAAPNSTKNAGNTRDSEMHQTKKGY